MAFITSTNDLCWCFVWRCLDVWRDILPVKNTLFIVPCRAIQKYTAHCLTVSVMVWQLNETWRRENVHWSKFFISTLHTSSRHLKNSVCRLVRTFCPKTIQPLNTSFHNLTMFCWKLKSFSPVSNTYIDLSVIVCAQWLSPQELFLILSVMINPCLRLVYNCALSNWKMRLLIE